MTKPCWSSVPEKVGLPAGRGRQIVADVQQGLRAEGTEVSVSKICRWFASAHLVLPQRQGSSQGSAASGLVDQGHDRRESIVKLSDRGGTAGF